MLPKGNTGSVATQLHISVLVKLFRDGMTCTLEAISRLFPYVLGEWQHTRKCKKGAWGRGVD